jgi:hypothetical protein
LKEKFKQLSKLKIFYEVIFRGSKYELYTSTIVRKDGLQKHVEEGSSLNYQRGTKNYPNVLRNRIKSLKKSAYIKALKSTSNSKQCPGRTGI